MPIVPNMKKLSDFKDLQRAVPQLEDNVANAITRISQQAIAALAPTNLKTAAYTAVVGELVSAQGTFVVTLPTATNKNAGLPIGISVQSGTVTAVGLACNINDAASFSCAADGLYIFWSDGVGWRTSPAGGASGVATVTAGAGLVNSGTGANPVIDMVSAGGTLTITANNAEVAAAIVSGAALGATSVQSVTAADTTIVIAGTAADPTVAVGVITEDNVDDTIVTEEGLAESEDLLSMLVDAMEDEVAILRNIDINLAKYANELPADLEDE